MNLVQTSVSSKGQMVLPAKLLARYNISQGTRITLLCDDVGFYVRKADDGKTSDLDNVVGMLSKLAALRPPRLVSSSNDDQAIADMLLADDQRIKRAVDTEALATRKRIKPLKLNP